MKVQFPHSFQWGKHAQDRITTAKDWTASELMLCGIPTRATLQEMKLHKTYSDFSMKN